MLGVPKPVNRVGRRSGGNRWPHRSVAERFWEKVAKSESCWLWTAGVTDDGYGHFYAAGKSHLAHRYAYEAVCGPIPPDKELDHLCRVRHCVRPEHLEAVTRQTGLIDPAGGVICAGELANEDTFRAALQQAGPA